MKGAKAQKITTPVLSGSPVTPSQQIVRNQMTENTNHARFSIPAPRKAQYIMPLVRCNLILFAFAGFALAQPIPQDHYIASAATTALTLQQPASNARQITFGSATVAGASVYCASASTATIKWNGAAATATAGTETKLPGTRQPSGMTVWTGSNVGTGTTGPVYNVPAGATMNIDFSWFAFGTQGTATNLTIATSNSCTITFAYSAI